MGWNGFKVCGVRLFPIIRKVDGTATHGPGFVAGQGDWQ